MSVYRKVSDKVPQSYDRLRQFVQCRCPLFCERDSSNDPPAIYGKIKHTGIPILVTYWNGPIQSTEQRVVVDGTQSRPARSRVRLALLVIAATKCSFRFNCTRAPVTNNVKMTRYLTPYLRPTLFVHMHSARLFISGMHSATKLLITYAPKRGEPRTNQYMLRVFALDNATEIQTCNVAMQPETGT